MVSSCVCPVHDVRQHLPGIDKLQHGYVEHRACCCGAGSFLHPHVIALLAWDRVKCSMYAILAVAAESALFAPRADRSQPRLSMICTQCSAMKALSVPTGSGKQQRIILC
jgi:hypothetical protein